MSDRGQYAKGVAKRQEILDVALEMVAESGLRSASSREIARRVNLTPAGLMHHFGSRDELYVEVLRARDERDGAQFWDPHPDFSGFLDIMAHNVTVPGLVQLYVEYSAEASLGKHPAHQFFKDRYEFLRTVFREALAASQRSGELGPHLDLDEAVDLMVASADGLQHQWLIDPSIDMRSRLEGLWRLLRAGSWEPPRASQD